MEREPELVDLNTASLFDAATQSDPYPLYRTLHEQCPVFKFRDGTDMYIISNYDDARYVLRRPDLFSNSLMQRERLSFDQAQVYEAMFEERGWPHMHVLQRTDPPDHGRYRRLVDKVFTASRVQEMAPRIDALAVQLVEAFADKGRAEIIQDLALPLPGIIFAQEIGLPASEIKTFKKWADTLITPLRGLSEAEVRELGEIELEMQHYFAREIEARRKEPRSDLLSGFVHAQDDENEPLTVRELQAVMGQLIGGGYETAISAIASGVWQLIRCPELVPQLRADRDKLRPFIEESLRFESPVQGLMRVTTQDVELGGVKIPADSLVMLRYAAANRDPARFECPHKFDIERKNVGMHIAFGGGPHFCPGAALARQELLSAYNAILDRIDDIELAEPLPPLPRGPSHIVFPMKTLPIKFTRIAATGSRTPSALAAAE